MHGREEERSWIPIRLCGAAPGARERGGLESGHEEAEERAAPMVESVFEQIANAQQHTPSKMFNHFRCHTIPTLSLAALNARPSIQEI